MPHFVGLYRAALAIALDNGGINCVRSVRQQKREFERWIAKQPQEPLDDIDAWLSALSDDDLQTACAGEHSEMQALLESAPPFTDRLLNDYFEQVC